MENIMKLIKFFVAVVSVILSLSVQANSETKQYTSESTKLLSQLQEQIRVTLLAVSNSERIAGKSMNDFHYTFSLPAQEITYLGLILELDNADNGYEVLSVTPGSAADKLDIKSGDRILKINDLIINNSTAESSLGLLNDLKPDRVLNLTVKSKKVERTLTTKLMGQFIPEISLKIGSDNKLLAMETNGLDNNISSGACGKVSIFSIPLKQKKFTLHLFIKLMMAT
jgi:C-terminal processing protease CtpA/Prc